MKFEISKISQGIPNSVECGYIYPITKIRTLISAAVVRKSGSENTVSGFEETTDEAQPPE